MRLPGLDRASITATAAFVGVSAICLAAPFERLQPLVRLPWQQISDVELAAALALGVWIAAAALTRQPLARWTPATMPAMALLAALFLAAALAPAHASNAFKVVARLTVAFLAFLMTVRGITTSGRMRVALVLAMSAGAVVGAAAIAEYAGWAPVLSVLDRYRAGIHVVGGQLRASGTLQYPTITSMYLEVVFALGLGLLVGLVAAGRWLAAAGVFGALLLVAEGTLLTFTRAGVVTMGVSVVIVAAWRWTRHGLDRGVLATGFVAASVAALLLASWSSEALRLRFTSENRQGWYRARFDAPAQAAFAAGDIQPVPVTVVNDGRITWQGSDEAPFYASYHWIDAESDRVIDYDGIRTAFDGALAPGESADLTMDVRAPTRAGRYRIVWDVVQEHRLWFSAEKGAPVTMTPAVVTGFTGARPPAHAHGTPAVLPAGATTVGRGTLWLAALGVVAAHPLLGIGLDNFRLVYGTYAHLDHPDPRVHTNDVYLEVLTGGGLLSGALMAWLIWRVAASVPAHWRGAGMTSSEALYSGALAAAVAIALHGLVDSFLTFTPTYLIMAVTFGLLMAPLPRIAADARASNDEAAHAHRV